jgi:hypothetical protein
VLPVGVRGVGRRREEEEAEEECDASHALEYSGV